MAPLFEGGTFDESYNSARQPVHVTTPNGTEQALLVAVITGEALVSLQLSAKTRGRIIEPGFAALPDSAGLLVV